MTSRDEQIRIQAHALWEQEGKPEGRAEAHWDMAREILAQKDGYLDTTTPVAEAVEAPAEEAAIQDNLGSFPTLTDQDEQQPPRK